MLARHIIAGQHGSCCLGVLHYTSEIEGIAQAKIGAVRRFRLALDNGRRLGRDSPNRLRRASPRESPQDASKDFGRA
jgi:hypothetical protein